jgi:hypothetical protein
MSLSKNKDKILDKYPKRIKKNINPLHPISILILNAPCHGFGDVIFGFKLKKYLNQWYPFADVKIATTKSDNFLSIGENPDSLIQLGSLSKELQCRRFSRLDISKSNNTEPFDLIFVAPLQADFFVSYEDVKRLIPYSNPMNTYFFSEYNDVSTKDIDFHTGIGRDKYGLLFTKIPSFILNDKQFLKSKGIKKNKYAVCYIANTIVNMRTCYLSFFEMVCKKYVNKKFTIIIPPSLVEDIKEHQPSLKKLYKYFSTIVLSKADGDLVFENLDAKNDNVLYLRADILPVKNTEMLTLIHNSVSDILVTGDQSVTDVLSCCPKKNIWYQIAGWKQSFASQLALRMPNKYLKRKSTSCGTIEAIGLQSDYRDFVKKYDFRKLARPKLNRIINMVLSKISK